MALIKMSRKIIKSPLLQYLPNLFYNRSRIRKPIHNPFLLFFFISYLLLLVLSSPTKALSYIQLGTGPSEGNYFKIGGILSSILSKPTGTRSCERGGNCGLSETVFTTKSTRGSSENVQLLMKRQIDLAFVQEDIYKSLSSEVKKKIHLCGALFKDQPHLVTRENDPYKTVTDLKHKKIALGTTDPAVAESMKRILAQQGLKDGEFVSVMLAPGQATDALNSKQADAVMIISNYPIASLRHLSRKRPLRILEMKSEHYQSTFIPAHTYGQATPCVTFGIPVLLIAREGLEPDFDENLTISLWNPINQRYLRERWKGGELSNKNEWNAKIQYK